MCFNPGWQTRDRASLRRNGGLPPAGRVRPRRKIFYPCLAKLSMPVIEPDLQSLVRECLLNNQIWYSVLIYIQSGDRKRGIIRTERQITVRASGNVQFNPEHPLTFDHSGIKQQGTIRILIVVKVGSHETRSKWGPKQARNVPGFRHGAPQAILCPQSGNSKGKQRQHKPELGTNSHVVLVFHRSSGQHNFRPQGETAVKVRSRCPSATRSVTTRHTTANSLLPFILDWKTGGKENCFAR